MRTALLDCAHNVEGLTASRQGLEGTRPAFGLVYAAVADKDVAEALSCLPDTVAQPPVRSRCAVRCPWTNWRLGIRQAERGRSTAAWQGRREGCPQPANRQELVAVLGSVFTVGKP